LTAIRIRFRAELRSRWRTWLALTLLAGFAGGLAVALASGADRTRTALGRFEVAVHGADAYVDPGFGFGEESLNLARVARLPQVVESEPTAHLTVISRTRDGEPIYPLGAKSVEYLVPMDGRRQDSIDRPKLLRGRLPNPTAPDEALGDSRALRFAGVHVGDTMTLRLVRHDLLWHDWQDLRLAVDPISAARWGPLVRVRIVGESANARTDVDGGQFRLSPAFYPAHGGRALGSWVDELPVRLRHGRADLVAFKAGVDRLAGDLSYGFFDPSLGRPQVQRSMTLQAWALELIAGFWSLAALLLVGQALFRQSAADSADHATLRALGMTRRQLIGIAAARSGLIAVPATALALLVAFLLSPLFPIGRAREIEPNPGFAVNWTAFAAGGALVLVTVLLSGVLACWRVTWASPGGDRPRAGLGSLAASLRRLGCPPVLVAGVRMALQRGRRSSPVPVGATLAAAILAVAVTAAALMFAGSVQHLLRTPRLYGQNWDFESGPPPTSASSFLRQLKADPAIAGFAVGAGAFNPPVDINGHEVGVRALDDVIGSVTPTVIEGRAPRRPDEILLGTKTLHALGAHIGGSVTMRKGRRAVPLRVVGRGVLPAGKSIKLGEGAALRFTALKRVDPEAQQDLSEIRFAPGVDRTKELARLTTLFDGSGAVRPQSVTDFGGVDRMPFLIAGLFVLAAVAALAHALLISIRRRRRELAIMKTLGFTRAQVVATVAWQATTVAAVGILIGLPLGLGVGRFTYNLFAENLGVVPDVVTPVGLALLVIPGAILAANLVAIVPSWAAAQTRPAIVLRAE
jgi:putative ABC transport system permease protein